MKEVLTKSFWEDVRKIFQEALEGRPPERKASEAPGTESQKTHSPSEAPPRAATSEKA